MFTIIRGLFATVFIYGSVFAVILGEPFVEKVAEYRTEHIAAITAEADTINQQAAELERTANPEIARQVVRRELSKQDANWKIKVAITGFAMPLAISSAILLAAYQMMNRSNFRLQRQIAEYRHALREWQALNQRMQNYTYHDLGYRPGQTHEYDRAEGDEDW